ncbi:hypothetical protein ElyMa_006221200 [Elysia marginata]|uniref:Uncharacterized protein n=1 Tax=Elysia marginata TaxID=1093978 RepID=A0AAV4H9G3_9GAST|nr:hypothetical protein ElyMa_006221200 [Elysia marginata]
MTTFSRFQLGGVAFGMLAENDDLVWNWKNARRLNDALPLLNYGLRSLWFTTDPHLSYETCVPTRARDAAQLATEGTRISRANIRCQQHK